MEQFVKGLDKTGDCFRYLSEVFPHLSKDKIKEDLFGDPDMRRLMKDTYFEKKSEISRERCMGYF